MSRPPVDVETRNEVLAEALADLSLLRTVTLVTYPPGESYPRLRGMGFVHEGWVLYMSTHRDWLKANEIALQPRVSVLFWVPERRRDHFVQIDAVTVEQTGKLFDRWQEMRYDKEGEGLRRVAARMKPEDWIGWQIEPVRIRLNGYINEGPWREAPLVVRRNDLGLPPLNQ